MMGLLVSAFCMPMIKTEPASSKSSHSGTEIGRLDAQSLEYEIYRELRIAPHKQAG